jgi:hypothetical protein
MKNWALEKLLVWTCVLGPSALIWMVNTWWSPMFHSPFHCPRLAHADRGTRLPDRSDFNMHTGKYYLLTITSVHQYTQTHLIIFNMCTLSTQCTFVHTEHLLNIKILVCTYFLKYAHIVHTVHIVLLLHLCAHCAHHAPLYYLFG